MITTARLTLQPIGPADASALHHLFCQPEVYQYLTDGQPVARAWIDTVIAESTALFAQCGLGLWAARCIGTDTIIGLVGFRYFYTPPVLELLYAVLPAYWQRGFAQEMAQAALDYAFTHTALTTIRASTDAPNLASIRVLERLGMRPCGRTAVSESTTFHWDQLHFSLSREAWEAGKTSPGRRAEDRPGCMEGTP
jgi:RimJ/RimL family protein N-acetyltransferase